MGCPKRFKDFFTKGNFDFDDPDINIHKYHPQLKIFLVINGIFFNNSKSKLRLIWPFTCVSLAIIAISFEISFIIHGLVVKDYAIATESFCYFIILTSIPTVIISIITNRSKILDLLNRMNNDLIFICTLGPRYKNPFLRGQLIIWKLCYIWLIFSSTVSSTFIMTCLVALTYQTLFAAQDENTERPLPFPVWLPFDDPYRTPNYELFLALEAILPFVFVHTFSVFVYILFHILLHCNYLMAMIFLDFEVIFEGLDESVATLSNFDPRRVEVQLILNRRMKRIIDWHTSVFKLLELTSSVFGPPLVYQVTVSSVAICLMAYQIVNYLDQGKIHFLFVLLSIATYAQLWIPCYLGSLLRNQAFKVGEACWRCGWQKTPLGLFLRSDITIVILRAQQPVNIKFPGLPRLDLETFSSMMSSSYSYFNILRQYK